MHKKDKNINMARVTNELKKLRKELKNISLYITSDDQRKVYDKHNIPLFTQRYLCKGTFAYSSYDKAFTLLSIYTKIKIKRVNKALTTK